MTMSNLGPHWGRVKKHNVQQFFYQKSRKAVKSKHIEDKELDLILQGNNRHLNSSGFIVEESFCYFLGS